MNPNGYIRTIHDLDEKQIRMLDNGGVFVVLTPDDILTLKLLRSQWSQHLFEQRSYKRRDAETARALETLERILKQVV